MQKNNEDEDSIVSSIKGDIDNESKNWYDEGEFTNHFGEKN